MGNNCVIIFSPSKTENLKLSEHLGNNFVWEILKHTFIMKTLVCNIDMLHHVCDDVC